MDAADIPTREKILALPKVDLHCHLDGSMRVETIEELAVEQKVTLPTTDPQKLRHILLCGRNAGSLEEFLKAFDLTLMVLQDKDGLARAAYDLACDAADENIWYLEVRFSPILHQNNGLRLSEIVDAVLEGLKKAEQEKKIRTGVIICGMRHMSPAISLRLAQLAVAYKNRGVVGFDLAGAEQGFPPKHHIEAFYLIRNNNINCTVHAGEGYGPESIHQAIHYCGAHRIGHCTRLREDGDLLNYVADRRIPLEICLTSNVQTGTVKSIEDHPFQLYFDYSLRVTLNTDNRLMSNTTVTDEYLLAAETFNLSMKDLKNIVIQGFRSSFLSYRDRVALLREALDEFKIPYLP